MKLFIKNIIDTNVLRTNELPVFTNNLLKRKMNKKEYNKKYRLEHKSEIYKKETEWRKNNIERFREKSRLGNIRYRVRNPEQVKINRQKTRDKLRTNVLEAYGNKCQCCGEKHREFLAIDHMNNNGAQHKRSLGLKSAQAFYTWLRKNNYPEGFQVLCHNCNMAKGFYGRCPHVK